MEKIKAINALVVSTSLVLSGCGETLGPTQVNLPSQGSVLDEPGSPRTITGFSQRLIKPYLDWNVSRGLRSGYVVLAARDGVAQYAYANGYEDIDAEKPMRLGTRFNIASMSKPVTAVAVMQLVSVGRLDLDTPVADYIPAFASSRVALSTAAKADGTFATEQISAPLRIRELLNFQAGMGQGWNDSPSDLDDRWSDYNARATMNLEELADAIAAIPLQEQPGEVWRYGLSLDVLARIVEMVSGQAFEEYVQEHIFTPLGMSHTGFMPPLDEREGMAVRYDYDAEGELVPAVLYPWGAKSRVRGGSGLVTTAEDYMRFALMLLNRGSYNGAQILTRSAHALMTQVHSPEGVLAQAGIEGLAWGLGIAIVADADASVFGDQQGDVFWSGAYGTHFWVSPSTGVSLVIMQQQVLQTFSMGEGRGQAVPYIVQEMLLRAVD